MVEEIGLFRRWIERLRPRLNIPLLTYTPLFFMCTLIELLNYTFLFLKCFYRKVTLKSHTGRFLSSFANAQLIMY